MKDATMKESLLNEDYYDKRSGFTRRKSTLPRTPFRMASDLAKQYTSLSQKMGTSAHTALYILYVGWFILCVPTIVVHVFLKQGYVVDTTYTIIWGWLVFSYTWQFVEGSITFKNHFDTFCLHRPSSDTGNIVYPPTTAIIVAYLPNEADIIMDTLAQFRAMHYDGELQVCASFLRECPVSKRVLSLRALGYIINHGHSVESIVTLAENPSMKQNRWNL
jgi:hypothetical protein